MEALRDIGHHLLNLEVNTILCDGITAEKMPGADEALTDIARRYLRFLHSRISELAEAGVDVSAILPVLANKDARVEFGDWQLRATDLATFEALRRAALCCIAALHRQPLAGWGPHEIILERIRGNAEQIMAVFRAL